MNPIKRVGLAAVLVVGVTLVARTPAQANPGSTVQLWNTGAEPDATGQAKLHGLKLTNPDPNNTVYSCTVMLTCQHLTPGAVYWTPLGTFTADGNGDGKVNGKTSISWGWMLCVDRLDPDGSWTRVLEYW